MKHYFSFFMAFALVMGIMILPAQAAQAETYYETETIYVEGIGEVEVETVTTVFPIAARSSTVIGEKTKTYKSNGTVIADVTLKATFGYAGSSAWVVSTSVTKTTYDGWSYGNQSTDKDGGTVTLSAELTKRFNATVPVSITMTCSPRGQIS